MTSDEPVWVRNPGGFGQRDGGGPDEGKAYEAPTVDPCGLREFDVGPCRVQTVTRSSGPESRGPVGR